MGSRRPSNLHQAISRTAQRSSRRPSGPAMQCRLPAQVRRLRRLTSAGDRGAREQCSDNNDRTARVHRCLLHSTAVSLRFLTSFALQSERLPWVAAHNGWAAPPDKWLCHGSVCRAETSSRSIAVPAAVLRRGRKASTRMRAFSRVFVASRDSMRWSVGDLYTNFGQGCACRACARQRSSAAPLLARGELGTGPFFHPHGGRLGCVMNDDG